MERGVPKAMEKTYCVIGLGNFGTNVALTLAASRKRVVVIDLDKERVNRVAREVSDAVCGDATDEAVLRQADVKDCECCIVCLERSIEGSAMITLSLKEMGIPHIIARASSERHEKLLRKLGADRIIFPERDAGRRLAQTVTVRDALEYFKLSEDLVICELAVPKSWVGKNPLELDIRKNWNVNVIAYSKPGTDRFLLTSDPRIQFFPDTYVVVAGDTKAIRKLTEK